MIPRLLILSPYFLLTIAGFAQAPQQLIADGNKEFQQKNFPAAQRYYEEAIRKDIGRQWPEAVFNLGNAWYEQKKFEEAINQFNAILRSNASASLKELALYNLGNCYLDQKSYQTAIEVYKQALKRNPRDEDARYNLTYAQSLLGGKQATQPDQSSDREVKAPVENNEPPPLSQEDLNRLLNELNEAESKTVKKMLRQNPQKASRDW